MSNIPILPDLTLYCTWGRCHCGECPEPIIGKCEVCQIVLRLGDPFDHRKDLQMESRYGKQHNEQVRDMGSHLYCSLCAVNAPPSKITHAYVTHLGESNKLLKVDCTSQQEKL